MKISTEDPTVPGQSKRPHDKHYLAVILVLLLIVLVAVSTTTVLVSNQHTLQMVHSTQPRAEKTTGASNTNHGKSLPLTTKVGGSITLTDVSDDKLLVSVEQVIPNATLGNPVIDVPPSSDQLVAVQVKITNESTQTLTDSVGDDLTLYDTSGLSYQPSFDIVTNCRAFSNDNGDFSLPPDNSIAGCETFEVPRTASVGMIMFMPSSGMASDTGTWTMP